MKIFLSFMQTLGVVSCLGFMVSALVSMFLEQYEMAIVDLLGFIVGYAFYELSSILILDKER